MDIKNFVLSHYKNSVENFHVHKVEKTREAQKPHTHEYFQIYFISKGRVRHHMENEWAQLGQGDMFIIPPGMVHYILPDDNTLFYSLDFMEDFITGQTTGPTLAKNFLRSLKNSEQKNVKPKISLDSGEILYVESIMAHILDEFQSKPLAYYDTIQAYAGLLVTLIARGYYAKTNIKEHFENNRQFVLHCIDYVENNFTDDISLEEISRRSAMSKSNFCSLFMNLTGHTFNSYLNMCRVKSAAEYIRQGYKITAIYGLCGYNDFSTFYRNFKKIMGMSPKEYKDRYS